MAWRPPTLADRLGLQRVRCGCGRTVWSDDMVDLTALPPGQRPRGDAHVCDSCWQGMDPHHTRRHDLLKALGAPTDVVDRHRAKHGRRG